MVLKGILGMVVIVTSITGMIIDFSIYLTLPLLWGICLVWNTELTHDSWMTQTYTTVGDRVIQVFNKEYKNKHHKLPSVDERIEKIKGIGSSIK